MGVSWISMSEDRIAQEWARTVDAIKESGDDVEDMLARAQANIERYRHVQVDATNGGE
jgi:hypothetical protein